MTGQKGGSGGKSSCQDYVVNSPKPLRKLDKITNPFKSLQEVELYLSGDKVVCLECGEQYVNLSTHIRFAHRGMSTRDYKIKYNIPLRFALAGASLLTGWKNYRKEYYKNSENHRELMDNLKKAHKQHKPSTGFTPKLRNISKGASPALKEAQLRSAKQRHLKYRALYIETIRYAINSEVSLTAACKVTGAKRPSIMAHLKNHPDDKEISDLFGKIEVRQLPKGIRPMNNRYQVRRTKNGKVHHLGTFDTIEEAEKVLNKWDKDNL